jgi:hypothetical protein
LVVQAPSLVFEKTLFVENVADFHRWLRNTFRYEKKFPLSISLEVVSMRSFERFELFRS